jgi:hypothetical protein
MKPGLSHLSAIALAAAFLVPLGARSQVIITEVDPAGSGNTNYASDWFEIRNSGGSSINLSGWKMDDNSAAFTNAVALRGITTLAPGQIAILLEGNATGTTDSTINNNFLTAWFGGLIPPGFIVGNYGGSGVGLSTSGDAVNLYDSGGNLMAGVTFGAAPAGATFDNSAGSSGAISQGSVLGANGAFATFNPNPTEIGSPGVVPEPSAVGLACVGLLLTSAIKPSWTKQAARGSGVAATE